MINVTKPFLPNIDKFKSYIDQIYDREWLTNGGPLVQELENRLADYLSVKNIVLVANGTLALQVAYKLLNISGDVITTPFSFAATSSSLVWEGLRPIYSDICASSFNLDHCHIEAAITQDTSAILPVHVFGNACEIKEIEKIALKNKLKVIYDASHAFGVHSSESSLLSHGDVSTLSFHATKLFHTVEGGALIIKDDALAVQARSMINFGIDNNGTLTSLGINAKMSELHAAMGLSVLDSIDEIMERRALIKARYTEKLNSAVAFQCHTTGFSENSSYLPILFDSPKKRLQSENALIARGISPRRYFYPSLNTVFAPEVNMPISSSICERILCLPLYPSLQNKTIDNICSIICENTGNSK